MEVGAEKSWGSGGMKEENQEAARGGGQATPTEPWWAPAGEGAGPGEGHPWPGLWCEALFLSGTSQMLFMKKQMEKSTWHGTESSLQSTSFKKLKLSI